MALCVPPLCQWADHAGNGLAVNRLARVPVPGSVVVSSGHAPSAARTPRFSRAFADWTGRIAVYFGFGASMALRCTPARKRGTRSASLSGAEHASQNLQNVFVTPAPARVLLNNSASLGGGGGS